MTEYPKISQGLTKKGDRHTDRQTKVGDYLSCCMQLKNVYFSVVCWETELVKGSAGSEAANPETKVSKLTAKLW